MTEELQIQRFLRNGGTPEELLTKYAITTKRHPRYPNLALFKYNMVESPFAERIVCECRGIILDEARGWAVTSRAFDKFFNHGEGHAAAIDWSTARVQEKLDGSLIVLYHYDGKWQVASSGTPDAGGNVHGFPRSFAELFLETFGDPAVKIAPGCERMCFYFELMTPFNRVVVRHNEPKVALLGARDLVTGQEMKASLAGTLVARTPVVWEHPLGTIADIEASFATLSPLEHEGYVVVDASFNRIKVKHPGYVALHHMKSGLSFKGLLQVARAGETSEVEAAFPEFGEQLAEMKCRVDGLVSELTGAYSVLSHIESQKEFALCATKSRCSGALFNLRAKKTPSIRQYIADMRIDALAPLLGYKPEKVDEPLAEAA